MRKKIVISALLNQIQVGLSENGHLVEYYWEPDCKKRLLGNIYKGRVENILPGMEAAFIDIGLEKNAFLYVADLYARQAGQAIQELLKVGQSILVQVFKEADGTKGPRVTTEIALPGRYLVLLPFQDHAGVSRQITADEERNRLREIAEQIRPPKMGLIIRTVAEGSGQKELEADLKYLRKEWRKIEAKAKKSTLSTLVYQDDDLIHRILRDFLTPGVTEIIVDNTKLHRRVLTELKDLKVKQPVDVIYYGGPVSLFEYLGLNQDLERARKKKVWLDCGGYLVFDQTEALLSIDVNTGGYVGGEDLRATVLKTNLQAAQEIAYQLRLRNIGGIVIIDFIDMPKEDQEAVADKLRQSLGDDKTRTSLFGFTQLGLLELTRQKSKKLLADILDVPCPACRGIGRVPADETVALQIAAEVYSLAREEDVEAILVKCHQAVGVRLTGAKTGHITVLEQETGKTVYVRSDQCFPRHQYELVSGSKKRVKEQACPLRVGDRIRATIEAEQGKKDGLATVNGFVVKCLRCSSLVGSTAELEIVKVGRDGAQARLVSED